MLLALARWEAVVVLSSPNTSCSSLEIDGCIIQYIPIVYNMFVYWLCTLLRSRHQACSFCGSRYQHLHSARGCLLWCGPGCVWDFWTRWDKDWWLNMIWMSVMFCMYGSEAPYAKATLSKTKMEPEVMISIADSSLTRSPIGFRLFHSLPQAIHSKVSVVSCVAHCMASCPSWWRSLPVDQVESWTTRWLYILNVGRKVGSPCRN